MPEDLTQLDNGELLLELGRERARAERRGCPVLAVQGRRPGVASADCTCFRLNAIETEIQRRLQQTAAVRPPAAGAPALPLS